MQSLEQAESSIQMNNVNTIENASKDRARVKKRKDEIQAMQQDFESNVRADPAEMDRAVKKEVEVALLRMTEKKMKVEMQLEKAMKTIEDKDARIAQLEQTIMRLQGQGPTNSVLIQDSNATVVAGAGDPSGADRSSRQQISQMVKRADTDDDLNQREEFTAEEELLRQDPTFGIGEIPNIDQTQGAGGVGKSMIT